MRSISYSETRVFSAGARAFFEEAESLVASIPRRDAYFEDVRCHELARAVGERLGLAVVDGHYGAVDHSWLVVPGATPSGDGILDVYAVGALPMVRLLDRFPGLPHDGSYVAGEDRDDVDYEMVASLLSVFGGHRIAATG